MLAEAVRARFVQQGVHASDVQTLDRGRLAVFSVLIGELFALTVSSRGGRRAARPTRLDDRGLAVLPPAASSYADPMGLAEGPRGGVGVELVDFVAVPTRDRARAVAWYRNVLGLPESDVTEGEVETPNVTLSFWEPEREDLPFVANEAGVALRVADVAAARAELEARGVEFIAQTWDSGVCRFAAFRDLDGNVLILHRRYAPRTKRTHKDS
jgi:catechol 2,3-dioxygenase-like lactoylglutathione lyase family enzyme